MKKSDLRRVYLDRRMALTKGKRADKSRQIAELFFANFDLADISSLHCFISIEKFGEVDTMPMFRRFWDELPAIITSAPRVDHETGDIEAVQFIVSTPLTENRWRIPEPEGFASIDPALIDVVIVPLLCFDLLGNRVGYGKGFYDRFLQKCRADCVKVGLSFFPPVNKIEDVHDGDIRLDHCVTPDGLVSF